MANTDKNIALDITVAIPTFNGAARLPQLLGQLKRQTHTESIQWEIIVCDNGSTDDTAAVVEQFQSTWPIPSVPLHYCFAAEQGAAFARQHAVESARGKLIAFLDDDNIPASDWVAQAHTFAKTHPKAGAFGSQIHGKFESELPAELENIKCFLAIIERGEQAHRYEPANKILPPAAGLIVRREAWLKAVPKRLFLNNKGKSAGLASEDLEAILHIQKSGWDIWYNPKMVVMHDIPDGRLRKDYLVTLFRCVGLSRYHIRLLGLRQWQRPFAVPAYIANDIRKLALHRLRHGAKQTLNTTDSCHRELLSSTLSSPLFLLNKAYKDKLQALKDRRHRDQQQKLTAITMGFEKNHFKLYQQSVFDLFQSPQNSHPSHPTEAVPSQKELLLRLDGAHQLFSPGDFMPTAQRYNLMRIIDRWVIRNLFEHLSHHSQQQNIQPTQQHSDSSPLYSINLSPDSIKDKTFPQFVASKLAQNNLPGHLFCFELPTHVALKHPTTTSNLISNLRAVGCRTTLDDIPLNATTASLLDDMPVDYIKLSADVVKTINTHNSDKLQLLKDIQKRHPIQVIAKGIESSNLLQSIKETGIRYAQGYQMSKPQALESPS
ncbi:MAG: hormogonium polysaccharide biosynthesis glycosyltransferase HpsE [Cyanobacteria bacterium J06614_10]